LKRSNPTARPGFWVESEVKILCNLAYSQSVNLFTERGAYPVPRISYLVSRIAQKGVFNVRLEKCVSSMVNGQWFIVSYDSANKQKHHKSHRMQ